MKIIAKTGKDGIATVYVADMGNGRQLEFVESIQPPLTLDKKWVLIISTLYGCPVGCRFCDAGSEYKGKVSKNEMFEQIDYLITSKFPDRKIRVEKFKIQFARMGEPSFNDDVLEVLEEFPEIYLAPGFIPSLSTIAPNGTDKFFQRLLNIKNKNYKKFQLQFSIHTTDGKMRDWLIPVEKWPFEKIADYGKEFYNKEGRKITLNFALADDMPLDPNVLAKFFSPDIFLIKITPVNPTYSANENGLSSNLLMAKKRSDLFDELQSLGYDVILSIGELEENLIGSNCGQYITTYKKNGIIKDAYTYKLDILNK